jgi:hypothetical protein
MIKCFVAHAPTGFSDTQFSTLKMLESMIPKDQKKSSFINNIICLIWLCSIIILIYLLIDIIISNFAWAKTEVLFCLLLTNQFPTNKIYIFLSLYKTDTNKCTQVYSTNIVHQYQAR